MKHTNRYATFWIKDLHHHIIEYSCNPQKLNNICVNDKPDAPFDITPVFFKREVLDKFYHAPHKYSVSDGEVNYKEDGLFLRVDTDMKDYVAVLLIDLAGLDYEEQLYWRSFNFKPDNTTTVSKAAYDRWYEGLFANSEASDAVLVKEYSEFYSSWINIIGWPLFKEDPQDPNSMLYSVHILTDENNSVIGIYKNIRICISFRQPGIFVSLLPLYAFLESFPPQETCKNLIPFSSGSLGLPKFLS